jgi:hypothetical protein
MAGWAIKFRSSEWDPFLSETLAFKRHYPAFIAPIWHAINDSVQIRMTDIIANNGDYG